ncbi:antagonist of mitotic exit network protein 1 [Diutina catenulata]
MLTRPIIDHAPQPDPLYRIRKRGSVKRRSSGSLSRSSSWVCPPSPSPLSRQSSTSSLASITADDECRFQYLDTRGDHLRCEPAANARCEPGNNQPHAIFGIPEIVHNILQFVDCDTRIPSEGTPIRRRPLSFKHAMMIHGNNRQKARAAISVPRTTTFTAQPPVLYNCLLVNQLWHQVAKSIVATRVLFANERHWHSWASQPSAARHFRRPRQLVLHKLLHAKQPSIEQLSGVDFSQLEWLELYMCPKLAPLPQMLSPSVRKIVITGSKVVDDSFLAAVAQSCPNLQVLDLRACELISDAGLYQVARRCRRLHTVNLGRKQKGHLITDSSVSVLAQSCRWLRTVGLAGCHISDRSVWELAAHCSESLRRLSLNNCPNLTNNSVPLILTRPNSYFHQLSVLELGHNPQITQWRPVIEFRRRQEYRGIAMVVELCETLQRAYQLTESEMDKVISERMFSDILHWANDPNDGDAPWQALAKH